MCSLDPYPEPDESIPLPCILFHSKFILISCHPHLSLSSGLFANQILSALSISKCAACPVHLMLLNLIAQQYLRKSTNVAPGAVFLQPSVLSGRYKYLAWDLVLKHCQPVSFLIRGWSDHLFTSVMGDVLTMSVVCRHTIGGGVGVDYVNNKVLPL
jgi:hypothetical protein